MNREKCLRYRITTLGCRVNQYESESIESGLRLRGWQPAEREEDADLSIINTCTVTARAAMQSRQAVRRAVRNSPGAAVAAAGCCVQSEPETFTEIEGVSLVIGNTDKHRIPEIIASLDCSRARDPRVICGRILAVKEFPDAPLPEVGSRARPFLKIQDGCSDFCTYCIVPYTRGPSRSMPFGKIIENIEKLAASGAGEAVLTGIHLGRYGLDLVPWTTLYELLLSIEKRCSIGRIRLSSIEPCELTDEIISMAAEGRLVCPHFHIPLQSGDRTVLQRMKRPYTPEFFRDLVIRIKAQVPDAAVGVDVLAGFPGETESAFENTCCLLSRLPVSYLHVFPYSPRPGTPAGRYPGQVHGQTIRERCARLRMIGEAKRAEFYRSQLGKTADVIFENKRDSSSGMLKGISANYLAVYAAADDWWKNRRAKCRLTGLTDYRSAACEIIEPKNPGSGRLHGQ